MKMDEQQLGEAMLKFEREQAAMGRRGPLPCDRKPSGREERGIDRSKQLLHLIEKHPDITTGDLYDKVSFGHGDFTASLRNLLESGKVLTGYKGRAKTYLSRKQVRVI